MKDMADITVILDQSGSMLSSSQGVINGFNKFVEDQRKTPGDGRWTLILFDSDMNNEMRYDKVFDGLFEHEVPVLTSERYKPWGGTPLYDAVCKAIDETGQRLAALPESERPNKVLFVIMTDGLNNASKLPSESMRSRILHQESKYNWKFTFVGANQDALATGSSYGVSRGCSLTYQPTSKGTFEAYNAISSATRRWKLDGNMDLGASNLMGSAAPDDPNNQVDLSVQAGMNP